MNIAEIEALMVGQGMGSAELIAICSEVKDRKTGSSDRGPWSLQAIQLKDDSGEIAAIIWNRDDVHALKGKTLRIGATKTANGWVGCSIEDKEYQGKRYRQLKLSGNFLLEEYKAAANGPSVPVAASNGNGHAEPSKAPAVPTLMGWGEYSDLIREAHKLANELEPDTVVEGGLPIDRGTVRATLVATILIAHGKRDFKFEVDPEGMPF